MLHGLPQHPPGIFPSDNVVPETSYSSSDDDDFYDANEDAPTPQPQTQK